VRQIEYYNAGLRIHAASERGSRLRVVVAFLPTAQGLRGLLRALQLVDLASAAGTLLWAVVPAIILVYLLTPAGRRTFST
jgi:hypothetical protein